MGQTYPVIDLHTHILPGIDDGSRSEEESLRLIGLAVGQGVGAMVATPHCHRQGGNPDPEGAVRRLMARVAGEYPGFRLYAGHETFYHRGLVAQLRGGDARTLAGSRWVLVEFSPSVAYGELFSGVRDLADAGYVPLLAHMERYACIRKEGRVPELSSAGCRFQMNYDSLSGPALSPEVRWCRRQVAEGRIYALGSDLHRTDFRPPAIGKALGWLLKRLPGEDVYALTHGNAARILKEGEAARQGAWGEGPPGRPGPGKG